MRDNRRLSPKLRRMNCTKCHHPSCSLMVWKQSCKELRECWSSRADPQAWPAFNANNCASDKCSLGACLQSGAGHETFRKRRRHCLGPGRYFSCYRCLGCRCSWPLVRRGILAMATQPRSQIAVFHMTLPSGAVKFASMVSAWSHLRPPLGIAAADLF